MPDINRELYDAVVTIVTKMQKWDDITAIQEYPYKTKFTVEGETLTVVFRYGNTVAFIGPGGQQYIEYPTNTLGQTAERIVNSFIIMAHEYEW